MDNRKVNSNPNPRENANIFSVLTWTWTLGIFKKSYSKILGVEDLYDPISKDKSDKLGDRLERQWLAEVEKAKRKKRSPSFLWAITKTFAPEVVSLALIQVVSELVLRLSTPMLLGALLKYFKPEPQTTYEWALIYAAGMAAATFVNVLLMNQYLYIANHTGGRVRISTCSVIYRKALRLSKTALGETAPGKIVNLVANDVSRFEIVFLFLNHMWSAPLSAIIIISLLYVEVGWPAFVGMVVVFLVVPLQGYLGKLSSQYRLQTALKTDERVRLMDEIISGVQVIKMYAWEKPFCALIELARRLELKVVKKSAYIRGIFMTFFLFTTRMALYGTLIAMMLRGQELSADKVFVYMSYYNMMAMTMSSMFVRGIAEIAESKVAVKRLQNFLMFEEFESGIASNAVVNSQTHDAVGITANLKQNNANSSIKNDSNDLQSKQNAHTKEDSSDTVNWAVQLKNVTAKWDLHSSETTLQDIDVQVGKGKLYILIGMVGSGKSSFIASILGELKLTQGSAIVNGTISYADQDAWIFGASVRQNIIFGQEFEHRRYQKVVKVCALQKDFEQFPHGDQTVVGDRGSSLSGGQKARINLARAVYREADIYLLDDPLSAVDAHVGKHLFEECIEKYLRSKTRILATHQLQYIKGADKILLLDQGRMHQFANYHELLRAYPEYLSLIAEEQEGEESSEETSTRPSYDRRISSTSTKSRSTESIIETDGEDESDNEVQKDGFYESTSRGTVKGNLLLNYMRSGTNMFVTLIVVLLFVTTQCTVSIYDAFIPILVNADESRRYHEKQREIASLGALVDITNADNTSSSATTYLDEESILPQEHYMYIFTGIVVSIFLVGIIRSFIFYTACLRASQRLHDLAFGSLIRATMRFFDTNASGRILNRFSKDLGAIDELLPKAILDATQSILTMFGAIVVTCTVNVYFVIPVVVMGALFFVIRKTYLKTSKNAKRLEGMTRSPVFTHLNATLNGITTIRAYQAQTVLKAEFDHLQDTHTSSWFMFITTSIAFGFSLDVCCFVFTTLVTFSFLVLKDNFSGGDVGLAITQVMSLTGLLQWGMRQSAEVTNQLMAVERVLEYSSLPSEPNLRDKGIAAKKDKHKHSEKLIEPPKEWPAHGNMDFKSVFMRYSDDDLPVLKNLSMTIKPSEKVGVVGRTGAGKSSLISALFRLAKLEGLIEIDGVDTGAIAVEDLRKHISIIPQDPILFSGTLRRNLDPFTEFPDEILWKVLEEVELKDAVKLTGNGLDHRVMDRGSNYSTGQRQLICLARAILRNNRILMLDEATANVDPHTDALIQRTIRTKFAPCTVLTVAHRLNTIMDSDKVLVMDKGCLLEFDHPHILLQNPDGPFTSLVKETGQAMYEQLCKVAHDSYTSKQNVECITVTKL